MPGQRGPADGSDTEVIAACLRAAADGPFFPEWEFATLFGMPRTDVRAVADAWPALPSQVPPAYSSAVEFQRLAVHCSMGNLLGYPHGHHAEAFVRDVGVDETQVREAFLRWRQGLPEE